jgi:Tol biopolymer transport system component
MNADGSGLKRITNEPTLERMPSWSPSWSPDGTKIAFMKDSRSIQEPDTGDIYTMSVYTMSADGTDLRKLTGKTEGAYSPAFSPDGKRIAFIGWDGGDKLSVMNADGKDVRRLTPDSKAIVENAPDWQPLPSS